MGLGDASAASIARPSGGRGAGFARRLRPGRRWPLRGHTHCAPAKASLIPAVDPRMMDLMRALVAPSSLPRASSPGLAPAEAYTFVPNLVYGTYVGGGGQTQNLLLDLYLPLAGATPHPLDHLDPRRRVVGRQPVPGARQRHGVLRAGLCRREHRLPPERHRDLAGADPGLPRRDPLAARERGAVRPRSRPLRGVGLVGRRPPRRLRRHFGRRLDGHDRQRDRRPRGERRGATSASRAASRPSSTGSARPTSSRCATSRRSTTRRRRRPSRTCSARAIQTIPALVATANPITFLSPDDPPFLIMHGTIDTTVPFNQSELLHAAAQREAGIPSTFFPVQGNGHGGPGFTTPAGDRARDHATSTRCCSTRRRRA